LFGHDFIYKNDILTNIQKTIVKKNEEIRISVKNDEKYCKKPQGVGCREKTSKRFLFFQK